MPNITQEQIEAAALAYQKYDENFHWDGLMAALKSLSAALSAQPVVKPLEWYGPDYEDEYWASWIGGEYTIGAPNGNGLWLGGVGGYFPTVEAAKAAAQADYSARILSALTTPPAPAASEPVSGQKCVACDDHPTGDNDPCAVCGATSPQPAPGHGARLALANALESRWPALDASVIDINAVLAVLTASGFTLAGTPKPVAWTDEASLKNLHYHNLVEVIGAHRNRTKKSSIALYRDPVPSDPDDWAAINGPCTPEGARIDAAVEAVASAIWERYNGVAFLQEYDAGDTYGADEIADFVRSLKLKIRQDVELPPAPLGAGKEG